MDKCKVLSSLYFRISPMDDFDSHIRYEYEYHINRSFYHIIDIEKWFESDFKEGEEYVTRRISKNGKYEFNRYLKGV